MTDDFDPDAYLAQPATPPPAQGGFDPDAYLRSGSQSSSLPVLNIPDYQRQYATAGLEQMGRGVSQLESGSPWEMAKGAGNVALGGMGYVGSWPNALVHGVVGAPVENVTGSPLAGELADVGASFALPTPKALAPAKVAEAPSIAELKATAKAAYESPEVKAVQIQAQAAPRLSGTIKTNLNDMGIDENLAPKTFGIVSKLEDVPSGSFLTVDNLRSLRRTLGRAAASPDPTERLAAKSAMQHVDEFLSNLPASDTIAGDPAAASAILKEANANYSAMSHAADLDVRMTRAQLRAAAANSGMNIGNTIRQRMADILVNPKLQRGFTADEISQMKAIVEGGRLDNATRFASNVLGGGGGLLAAMYGLAHAGVAPIAGYLLRRASNAQTLRAAERLNESVRARSPLGQARGAAAQIGNAPSPRLGFSPALSTGVALPELARFPGLQSPSAVYGQDDQQNIPRPPGQQQRGGAIKQKPRAAGGKVETKHARPLNRKFKPEAIGARKAPDGRYYIHKPHPKGQYMMVVPRG